ncbi:site-specific DNA-methyltransferase [Haloarchaeobius sp. FL176]|uniref:DNA-methyltransferase n=1 Tax=Haloarchaeobius sp. FL176 TaxID=2967129 RepID=UPI0021494B5C|nr:site-specific DNA-methyltransferase [Haloarchaeobius sp. FL176]
MPSTLPVSDLLSSSPAYTSDLGAAYHGDSRELLQELPTNSIDLVVTSPPFDLAHQKEYGDDWGEEDYQDWFLEFAAEVKRVLAEHGSFVIEIGGAFEEGTPVRSTYQFELLARLTSEEGMFQLAQDFYWHNPAKLPSPAEWVNRRRIRVSDAVTHVWWLAPNISTASATEDDEHPIPEADNRRVLTEFSDSQKYLLHKRKYNSGERPSGHNISEEGFFTDAGGAIPDNLFSATNTRSQTHYDKMCQRAGLDKHPARFPPEIPEFFIQFLTPNSPYENWDRGYLDRPIVLDIFGGSNITGKIAEDNDRHWLAFEKDQDYLESSELRFLSPGEVLRKYEDEQRGLDEFTDK